MAELRLIDENALKVKFYSLLKIEEFPPMFIDGVELALAVADVAPTIDAVPVVHGRWIYGVTLNHEWRKCSECLVSQEIFGCFTYCPHCGAKMDGGATDDNQ